MIIIHPSLNPLLTSFTVFVNRRDKTSGHLFQGRFKAQLVEGDGYYDTLSRYIHLNPVRTQAAQALPVRERRRELAAFPWSSFPALIGLRTAPEWLKTEDILNGFGATPRKQASGYRRYVEEGLLRDLADHGEAARVQGGISVPTVVAAVAAACAVPARSLWRRDSRHRAARRLAMGMASHLCRSRVSRTELARAFGISCSALALAAERLEQRAASSPRLRQCQQAVLTTLKQEKETS